MRSSDLSLTRVARLLYTHNPFYLIGTLLVLLGLQQAFGNEPSLETSGTLVTLLGGYTLLLAGVAAIIIRCGQVWDDARTILLVIVLLFFMLSASLDFRLLDEPFSGTRLMVGGLAFSILLSEGLLRGLRIRLAARYRVPYYLMLTLLFAYPVAIAWISYHRLYAARSWSLIGFATLAAIILLTLLPAARAPAWREPASNTPWRWPFFPWSLFVFLTIGVAIRAWWLTISFDTAKGPVSGFRPYFLLPLCIAWAVLLVEIGRTRNSFWTIGTGLALPLGCGLIVGFPGPAQNLAEAAMLDRLLTTLGSPPQLAVWSMLGFYGWTWLRGVRGAEGFLIGLGLLASVLGPQTLDWTSLVKPQPVILAGVAAALFSLAVARESMWRAVVSGTMIIIAAFFGGLELGSESGWFWQWHAPLVALLALTAVFNDRLAKLLREASWRAAPCLALAAAAIYPWMTPRPADGALASYLLLLLGVSVALWQRQKDVASLAAALGTVAANLLAGVRNGYLLLEQTTLAGGLPWLAGGLAIVAVAFVISLGKMGLWHWGGHWLARINAGATRWREV